MTSQEAGTPMESSSSTSIETSEDIQRILFRLVRADTDGKLQAVTDRYLCDVIELAAQKEEHRQLVTAEFLSPFNKMVRSNLAIRLPVVRLLQLFQGNCALSSNFSLIYLKFAKDRLEAAEQLEVLPAYLRSFSKKPTDLNYIYDIFSLCLPGLFRLAEMEKKHWPNLDMTSGDVEILARCFEAVLVFNETSRERITNALAGRLQLKDNGLCLAEFVQIARKVFPEQLNLTETKMMILKVLGKELLDDKIAFPIFVVARESKLNEVDDLAENLLKKIPTEKLVNERSVVDKLMYLYLGSETFMKKPADPLLLVQQGPPAVQQAVLSYLIKSTEVLTAITSNVKICLFGCESIHARVQTAAMNFFNHCAEKMPDRYLKPFADKMFKTLRKLSSSDSITTLALCGTYRCLAVIGKRTPSLVLDDAAVITKMFEVLSTESVEDVSSAIVSCLTTWLPLFLESEKAELRTRLREFISEYINSESPNCRLAALKYAEALIGENDINLRWILIQSAGDQRDSIRSEALRQLEKSLQKPTPPPSVIIGALWSSLHKDYRRAANETTNTTVNTYNSLVHQIASKYLYAVFETIVMKEAAHLRIVEGDDHWMTVAPRIVQLLHGVENIEMIEKATELALYATVESTDVHLFRIASCFLAAFRSSSKEAVSTRFQFAVPSCVLKLRDSTRMEFSTTVAYLLSALIHDDQAARLELFNTSKLQLKEKEIPGLAFTCASMLTPLLGAQFIPPVMPSEFIKDVFLPLIKNGFQRPTSTLESTLGALVFLLHANPTALDRKTHKEVMDDLIVNCEKIAVSRQDSFSQKTRGFCAKVIGLFSGDVENDESNFEQSRESLVRIGSGPPQQELQLIVGEAIVDCILGRWAISKRDYYLLGGDTLTLAERMQTQAQVKEVNERLFTFIIEILADRKTNANRHIRKAELIWLLIVVQSFSVLEADVLKNAQLLGAIQNAFTDGLAENNEFSQDISAKGMGIVYGLADGSLKMELVESLMDTLFEERPGICLFNAGHPRYSTGFFMNSHMFKIAGFLKYAKDTGIQLSPRTCLLIRERLPPSFWNLLPATSLQGPPADASTRLTKVHSALVQTKIMSEMGIIPILETIILSKNQSEWYAALNRLNKITLLEIDVKRPGKTFIKATYIIQGNRFGEMIYLTRRSSIYKFQKLFSILYENCDARRLKMIPVVLYMDQLEMKSKDEYAYMLRFRNIVHARICLGMKSEIFSKMSGIHQIPSLLIRQSSSRSANIVLDFEGRQLRAEFTRIDTKTFFEFVDHWKSGRKFERLERLELVCRFAGFKDRVIYDGIGAKLLNQEKQPPAHTISKSFPDNKFTEPIVSQYYVVRQTDGHVASVLITQDAIKFGVWDRTEERFLQLADLKVFNDKLALFNLKCPDNERIVEKLKELCQSFRKTSDDICHDIVSVMNNDGKSVIDRNILAKLEEQYESVFAKLKGHFLEFSPIPNSQAVEKFLKRSDPALVVKPIRGRRFREEVRTGAAKHDDKVKIVSKLPSSFYGGDKSSMVIDAKSTRMSEFAKRLQATNEEITEWGNPLALSVDFVYTYGQIVHDDTRDNEKFGENSVALMINDEDGTMIRLNFSKVTEDVTLFPGQIIAVRGTNETGEELQVDRIFTPKALPVNPVETDITKDIWFACGPYTAMDNCGYEQLCELLDKAIAEKPDILILAGPFVDRKNTFLNKPTLTITYDNLMEDLLCKIKEKLVNTKTEVIIQPSSSRDLCTPSVFPSPAFRFKSRKLDMIKKELHFVPDPCIFRIGQNGVDMAVTSSEPIQGLSNSEFHRSINQENSDRIARLCSHLLTQQSLYPLEPTEIPSSLGDLLEVCQLTSTPHIAFVPSQLPASAEIVNGSVFINSSTLAKGPTGNYVKMSINLKAGQLSPFETIADYANIRIMKI
ncbi:unnamed protein product [Caenorhabditis nigoni]|nr:hypothetical protein B9Z55_009584 [Caenorhabditis nigoni]